MGDSAAFFRLEGTLSPRPSLAAAAWLAGNAQGLGERLARIGNVALAAPFLGGPLEDPLVASRVAWMGLRGITEDRLIELSRQYAERFVVPGLRETGQRLLTEARARGHRPVLISDNLDLVARPVAEHLGVEDLVCNELEMRKGRATGRLGDPVIGGALAGRWARDFADAEHLDLRACAAYGAHGNDSVLLGLMGHPCAVHPDRALRRMARDMDWPVVES